MTIKSFKKMHRSCWADLHYVGLQALGIAALNKKTMQGGKITWPVGDTPYTGRVGLLVNCGGLTNKVVKPAVKEIFKRDVLPVLKEHFPTICRKYTGRIELHFRESRLTTFTLTR